MTKRRSDDESMAQTLVGVSFANSFRAQEFLTAASGLAAGRLKLKDNDGRTVVHETIDPSPGQSALSGPRRFQSGCGVLDEEG